MFDITKSAEEANGERIGSFVETDRQKKGYPTELWRERETAAYVAITNW